MARIRFATVLREVFAVFFCAEVVVPPSWVVPMIYPLVASLTSNRNYFIVMATTMLSHTESSRCDVRSDVGQLERNHWVVLADIEIGAVVVRRGGSTGMKTDDSLSSLMGVFPAYLLLHFLSGFSFTRAFLFAALDAVSESVCPWVDVFEGKHDNVVGAIFIIEVERTVHLSDVDKTRLVTSLVTAPGVEFRVVTPREAFLVCEVGHVERSSPERFRVVELAATAGVGARWGEIVGASAWGS